MEPLKKHCDKIIGIYINLLKKISISNLNHSYNVADRALKIRAASDSIPKFSDFDLIVAPEDLGDYDIFEMNNTDVIFEMGYTAAVAALKTSERDFKNS